MHPNIHLIFSHPSESRKHKYLHRSTNLKAMAEEDMSEKEKANMQQMYDALCPYIPQSVRVYMSSLIQDKVGASIKPPLITSCETVALFADVSGFTKLSESLAARGPEGAQDLAHHLNGYISQMVKLLSAEGGDIFKFAGDALIVLWPSESGDVPDLTRRATQAALEIQKRLDHCEVGKNVYLSVKIGIGIGKVSVVLVGGVFGRMEYLATGSPLTQAFAAEHHSEPGDVILSPEAWDAVKEWFTPKTILEPSEAHPDEGNFVIVGSCIKKVRSIAVGKMVDFSLTKKELVDTLRTYVPGAVAVYINTPMEKYVDELRRVAIVFVNVGFSEEVMVGIAQHQRIEDVERVHEVVASVQTSVYRYEGSLNKFLFDDKGSTLLAAFGLPPLAHVDDSLRAVLAGMDIIKNLKDLGLNASIGISTGTVFTGISGSVTRKEYAVLGDTVNLSARLMQNAGSRGGGIICDSETHYLSHHQVDFDTLDSIMVKGKSMPIKIYAPLRKGVHQFKTQTVTRASVSTTPSSPASSSKLSSLIRRLSRTSNAPAPQNSSGVTKMNGSDDEEEDEHIDLRAIHLKNRAAQQVAQGMRGAFLKDQGMSVEEKTEDEAVGSLAMPPGYIPTKKKKSKRHHSRTTSLSAALTRMDSNFGLAAEPIPCWFVKAEVMLPPHLDGGSTVHLDITGDNLEELKIQTLAHLNVDSGDAEEYVFGYKGFLFEDESLRLDVAPVLCKEMGLEADATIKLDLLVRANVSQVQHDRFDERTQIAKCVQELVDERTSNVLIIEGTIGIGKTRLITETLCNAPVLVCCGTTTAVGLQKPMEVFGELLVQVVDFELGMLIEQMAAEDTVIAGGNRSMLRCEYVIEKLGSVPLIQKLVPCLNEISDLDFTENEQTMAMTDQERLAAAGDVFVTLLQVFSDTQAIVMVLDDIIFMDAGSWALTKRISDDVTSILLVLSTPPMNRLFLRIFNPNVAPQYQQLRDRPHSTMICLKPLPDSVIHETATHDLHCDELDSQLAATLTARCRGNPLVLKELIFALRQEGMIYVGDPDGDIGRTAHLILDTQDEKMLPVPIAVLHMLGARVDRLTHIQQMMLKVSSLIGVQWTKEDLIAVYPIEEHVEKFDDELQEMVSLEILDDLGDGLFGYTDGFMREVVNSRVLDRFEKPWSLQVSRLKKPIPDPRVFDVISNTLRVSKTHPVGKKGWYKTFSPRLAKIGHDFLGVSSDTHDWEENGKKLKHPWRIVHFNNGCQIEVVEPENEHEHTCLCITSGNWTKPGKSVFSRNDTIKVMEKEMVLYMQFPNAKMMTMWKKRLEQRVTAALLLVNNAN